MVNCPLCDAALDFDEDELDEGDELTCEECGEMVRVSGKEPIELEAVNSGGEEEDDFDEDEEDEEYEEGESEDELEEDEANGEEDWR